MISSYMFWSSMCIIRELHLYLTKAIYMLQHSVKLRHQLGDVAACRRAACVLCAVLHTTHIPPPSSKQSLDRPLEGCSGLRFSEF